MVVWCRIYVFLPDNKERGLFNELALTSLLI